MFYNAVTFLLKKSLNFLVVSILSTNLKTIEDNCPLCEVPAHTADLYYLHGDHLGTATFVKDGNGENTLLIEAKKLITNGFTRSTNNPVDLKEESLGSEK